MCSGWRGAPFSCMPPQGGVPSVYPSILASCLSRKEPFNGQRCDIHCNTLSPSAQQHPAN